MRHEQHGDARLFMDALDLVLQACARDGVHGAERLVGQQDVGARRQRAGDAHALRLAARQLGGVAVHDVARQPDDVHPLLYGRLGAVLVAAVQQRGHVRDVLLHGEMGEQHAALDGVADVAAQPDGVGVRRGAPVHEHFALVGHHERVHHLQQRGLAAAGAADDGNEHTLRDGEVHVVHGVGVPEPLGHVLERHGGRAALLPAVHATSAPSRPGTRRPPLSVPAPAFPRHCSCAPCRYR